MILKPFFSYFGSKYRLAPKYKSPSKDILIEPFAGSACYSLHYPHKQVKLYDKYDVICGVWEYLIHAKEQEILDLPILDADQTVDDFSLIQEAKWLIGFCLVRADFRPAKKLRGLGLFNAGTSYEYKGEYAKPYPLKTWSVEKKQQITSQLRYIRHWTVEQKSYDQIENMDATWFIDPPYQIAGKIYVKSSKDIDFNHLGNWCKEREGEIIVCENKTATWLPFQDFSILMSTQGKETFEVVYYQGFENESEQLTLF